MNKESFSIIERFIVFEGLDGAGTTTQTRLLENKLKDSGYEFTAGCEPTKGFIGRTIRKVLGGEEKVAPGTLAKLFAADRHEHLYNEEHGIVSLCGRGEIVVSDRYLFSSLAYQSLRYGFDKVFALNREFPLPEHLFFLDVEEEVCQSRLNTRDSLEIFEEASLQSRIRANYMKAFSMYEDSGMKIHILDGTDTPEELGKKIWSLIF